MNNYECYQYDLKILKTEFNQTNFITKGILTGKAVIDILKYCDEYFHIEIQECSYDGNDYTDIVWIDIEGIDYGWMWMRFEDNHQAQHDELVRRVKEMLNELLFNHWQDDKVYHVQFETEEGKCVRIYNQNNDGYAYNLRFSHKEIIY